VAAFGGGAGSSGSRGGEGDTNACGSGGAVEASPGRRVRGRGRPDATRRRRFPACTDAVRASLVLLRHRAGVSVDVLDPAGRITGPSAHAENTLDAPNAVPPRVTMRDP